MPTQYVEDQNRRRMCPYAVQVNTVRKYSIFDKFMTGTFISLIVILDVIWLSIVIPICINSTLGFCDLSLLVFMFALCPIGISIFAVLCAFSEIKQWSKKI